jgi:hypothetical protein
MYNLHTYKKWEMSGHTYASLIYNSLKTVTDVINKRYSTYKCEIVEAAGEKIC